MAYRITCTITHPRLHNFPGLGGRIWRLVLVHCCLSSKVAILSLSMAPHGFSIQGTAMYSLRRPSPVCSLRCNHHPDSALREWRISATVKARQHARYGQRGQDTSQVVLLSVTGKSRTPTPGLSSSRFMRYLAAHVFSALSLCERDYDEYCIRVGCRPVLHLLSLLTSKASLHPLALKSHW